MKYATVADIEARMNRELSESEENIADTLLGDAGIIIDTFNANASADAKLVVSCRMVIRALGDGSTDAGVPLGATQGSMSALGYSQSWTMGNGASVGELYLAKLDKQTLGYGNKIGTYSPVEELIVCAE